MPCLGLFIIAELRKPPPRMRGANQRGKCRWTRIDFSTLSVPITEVLVLCLCIFVPLAGALRSHFGTGKFQTPWCSLNAGIHAWSGLYYSLWHALASRFCGVLSRTFSNKSKLCEMAFAESFLRERLCTWHILTNYWYFSSLGSAEEASGRRTSCN